MNTVGAFHGRIGVHGFRLSRFALGRNDGEHMTDKSPSFLRWREIPASIWALGLVSLLMDVSSEMIHALLPLYLVGVLGASTLTVGVIEGIAEATASITKIFSGALSDYLGKRKFLAALGYGLAALTKPIFPLAPNVGWLTTARFVDRLGKGIRGAPRDALIADLTPPGLRGASFGLRQSLDTVGAFLGPLLAILFMLLTANQFTLVFWIAVLPAFLSVGVIIFGVSEPERPAGAQPMRNPLRRAELARLGRAYWVVVGVATLFTLARFSEAFLLLRAQSVGLNVALVPAVMVVMNVVYAAAAWRRHRGGALGAAHGVDPGAARGAGRRHRAGRAARHRVRHVQPRHRARHAGREHSGRRVVGLGGAARHIPGGRGVHRIGADRAGAGAGKNRAGSSGLRVFARLECCRNPGT